MTSAGNRRQAGKSHRIVPAAALVLILTVTVLSTAIESGIYRLLSVSESTRIILIAQLGPPQAQAQAAAPSKTVIPVGTVKYVLDATSAKITVNGKPAEFKELKNYATAQVKFELKKFSKLGIDIDGKATEIRIILPGTPPQ